MSLYKLEDKQKPRTKLSMFPINIHIGEPKTAFTKILAAYGFLKIEFKVLKQLYVTSLHLPKSIIGIL